MLPMSIALDMPLDMPLDLAETAALIGDVSRAKILSVLLDGRASTALELSIGAGISPPTASVHLAKLVEGKLLQVNRQGRHRYFRLASPQVARALETIMDLAATTSPRHARPLRMAADMRRARTCYDHIAGEIGVAIADALLLRDLVQIDGEAGVVTDAGRAFFAAQGIDLTPGRSKRIFCRPCIDWSERRPHLGGQVGAAICDCALRHGWLRRRKIGRALDLTSEGAMALPGVFGPALCFVCEPLPSAA